MKKRAKSEASKKAARGSKKWSKWWKASLQPHQVGGVSNRTKRGERGDSSSRIDFQ